MLLPVEIYTSFPSPPIEAYSILIAKSSIVGSERASSVSKFCATFFAPNPESEGRTSSDVQLAQLGAKLPVRSGTKNKVQL